MTTIPEDSGWFYVFVQSPGGNEMYLGQHDNKNDISFIPVFHQKEHAFQCLPLMTRDRSLKYEVQLIHREEISQEAANSGFLIYVLDEEGVIRERIDPAKDRSGK